MPEANNNTPRFLRPPEADRVSGLRKTQRYSLESQGKFPARVKLSERCVAYVESEVLAWVAERIQNGRVAARCAS